MSRNKTLRNVRVLPDGVLHLQWIMKFRDGVTTRWMWQVQGGPPLHELAPIRKPRSSSKNRHIPVSAYSHTNSGVLHLESGLEHDLVRKLDRDPDVALLIAQPFRLEWTTDASVSHVPDLLTQHTDGSVTVWDARSSEQQDDDFHAKSAVSRRACDGVGWRYQVFTGVSITERMNLLWLHGFRRRPPWADRFEEDILGMAGRDDQIVGSLLAADDGTGEATSVVWHLVWTGALRLDLSTQWTLRTPITASRDNRHV